MDLCSYFTTSEVEKVRTANHSLASSHHDRIRGAMLFAQEFHSVAQNKVWNYMNHPLINSTNTNKIWKESWGRACSMSDFQPSDLFNDYIHCELHCYNTAGADNLATQRTRSSSSVVLRHWTRNSLISTQEILIFWRKKGLLNESVYHILLMIHYQLNDCHKTSKNYWGVI